MSLKGTTHHPGLHTPLITQELREVLPQVAEGEAVVFPGDGPGPGDLLMLQGMAYRVQAEVGHLESVVESRLPGVEVIQSESADASGSGTTPEVHEVAFEAFPPKPNSLPE